MKSVTTNVELSGAPAPARRPYQAPALTEYGAVRHLTQGGSLGDVEVGNSNMNFMV